jgi:hypothetical protein
MNANGSNIFITVNAPNTPVPAVIGLPRSQTNTLVLCRFGRFLMPLHLPVGLRLNQ